MINETNVRAAKAPTLFFHSQTTNTCVRLTNTDKRSQYERISTLVGTDRVEDWINAFDNLVQGV